VWPAIHGRGGISKAIIWEEYTKGKQTYSLLAKKYQCPIKTIQRKIENLLTGACGSCPYSIMTLKNGVESTIRKALPEIKSVEAINI
jgi:hypothetical protein